MILTNYKIIMIFPKQFHLKIGMKVICFNINVLLSHIVTKQCIIIVKKLLKQIDRSSRK